MLKKLSVKILILIGMVALYCFGILTVFSANAEPYNDAQVGVTIHKDYDIATASEGKYADLLLNKNGDLSDYYKNYYAGGAVDFHSGYMYEADKKGSTSTVRLFDEHSGTFSIIGQGFYDAYRVENDIFVADYGRLTFQFTNLANNQQYYKFSFTQAGSHYLELNVYYYDIGVKDTYIYNATKKIAMSFTEKSAYMNNKNVPFRFEYVMATQTLNMRDENVSTGQTHNLNSLTGATLPVFENYSVDMLFENKSQQNTAKFTIFELCGVSLAGDVVKPQITVNGQYRNAYLKGESITVHDFTATDNRAVKESGVTVFKDEQTVQTTNGALLLDSLGEYKIVYYAVDNANNRYEEIVSLMVSEMVVAQSVEYQASLVGQSIPQISVPSGWYYQCALYLKTDTDKQNALVMENGAYVFDCVENYIVVYSVIPEHETVAKLFYQTEISVKDTQKPSITLGDAYANSYTVGDSVTLIDAQVIDNSANVTWDVAVFYGEQAVTVGADKTLILDKVGTYEIRYTATDLSGNAETLSVRILVQEKALEQSDDTHSKKENAWVIPVIVGASVLVVGVVVAVILFKRKED